MMYLQHFMLGLETMAFVFCIIVAIETIISIIQDKKGGTRK